METIKTIFEEIKVLGQELAEKVKALIHEGNVRRIIIKDENGHTFIEIPVTVAAVGAVFAPILAAVGALAAMVAKFTIVVEKTPAPDPAAPATKPAE
jgi:hypothetical protein